jgi:aminoglycoside phosphotransferase (APT) family kinase protein
MSTGKMHADELYIDSSLVARLLTAQFPDWADLPIEPLHAAGTDHTIYRLGSAMTVRLPRTRAAAGQVEKEERWLRQIAPFLPLTIPFPMAKGMPGEGYPWNWAVYRWLEGETVPIGSLADPGHAATTLAEFVAALHQIDLAGGPPAGPNNSFRGVPLARRDPPTRAAIAQLHATLDADAATAAWEEALNAPAWNGPAVWLHGDLLPGNLLAKRGRLIAVIDFGCLGLGDPACDVMVAWTYLSAGTREAFRATLSVDDATWARGRGWALSFGLIALPYYVDSNPALSAIARHAIDEVLADFARAR